jgi:hypothetical protein
MVLRLDIQVAVSLRIVVDQVRMAVADIIKTELLILAVEQGTD